MRRPKSKDYSGYSPDQLTSMSVSRLPKVAWDAWDIWHFLNPRKKCRCRQGGNAELGICSLSSHSPQPVPCWKVVQIQGFLLAIRHIPEGKLITLRWGYLCRFTQLPRCLQTTSFFGVSAERAVQSQMFVSCLERLECYFVSTCIWQTMQRMRFCIYSPTWGLFCEGMCALSQQRVYMDLKHLLVNGTMSVKHFLQCMICLLHPTGFMKTYPETIKKTCQTIWKFQCIDVRPVCYVCSACAALAAGASGGCDGGRNDQNHRFRSRSSMILDWWLQTPLLYIIYYNIILYIVYSVYSLVSLEWIVATSETAREMSMDYVEVGILVLNHAWMRLCMCCRSVIAKGRSG